VGTDVRGLEFFSGGSFFSAHEFHLTGFLIFFSAKRFFIFFQVFSSWQ